ncbi:MAG TPA: methionine synthase [Spirochaetota bacterium]|nr:methionine synthase [Spirochaetota bacterium]
MINLNNIERIPVVLPEKEILARLKYNIHKTEMDEATRSRILGIMNRGFAVCEPRGVWTRIEIEEARDGSVLFAGGYSIASRSVADLLRDSSAAVLMAVTVGPAIVELASSAVNSGDGASALVYDAVGSETAEAAIDWLNMYIAQQVKRRGENLTRMRFSAGYGDFMLENQKLFFEVLHLEKLGVSITDRYIFIPEKTVTAIAGIEAP